MADRRSVIQVKFRLRKTLLTQLKKAADAADCSLNEEIEERLKQSFQQKKLQEAFEKGLKARLDVARDEILKRMRHDMREFRREVGLPEKDDDEPHRPGLLDLAQPSEQPKGGSDQGSPDDTSEPSTTEDDSGGKK
jgi:hypothetical protein